jgi:hypothetical protein
VWLCDVWFYSATNSPLSLFEYCTCGNVRFFIHGTCVHIHKSGSFSSPFCYRVGYRFCSYFLVHFALVTKPRRPKTGEEKKIEILEIMVPIAETLKKEKKEIKPLSTTRAIARKKKTVFRKKAECAGVPTCSTQSPPRQKNLRANWGFLATSGRELIHHKQHWKKTDRHRERENLEKKKCISLIWASTKRRGGSSFFFFSESAYLVSRRNKWWPTT